MSHHTVIYNPAAGQGSAGKKLVEVKTSLAAAGIDCTIHLTEGPGHAVHLASAAAAADTEVVIAAGGNSVAGTALGDSVVAFALPD